MAEDPIEATRRARIRRPKLIWLLVLIPGAVALWCGWLWRLVPRVESFPPEPESVSEQPFAFVFRETGSPPSREDAELMRRAEALLAQPVLRITDKPYRAPTGDARDYISLGIYWWPNPLTRLPYLRRDGRRNPEADRYDAPRLNRVVDDITTLVQAFAATGDERFAHRAREQLAVWFIAPESRMNPHLTFAQMMPGWAAGGRQGIIEGLPLALRLPDALAWLDASGALQADERRALRDWLGRYLAWLRSSRSGRAERSRPNNHGTWHDVQVAALATSLGLTNLARETLLKALRRIETQFLSDGRQPAELRRTKSFEYSLYNLEAWLHLALLGRRHGIEIWHRANAAGGSPAKALEYLKAHASCWPHPSLQPPDRSALEAFCKRVAAQMERHE